MIRSHLRVSHKVYDLITACTLPWHCTWPLVLGSPVQSGLLSKFDKTRTWTGPASWRTSKNWTEPTSTSSVWFWLVFYSWKTSLNWLRTGLVATDNVCNWVSILLSLVLQQGYPSFSFRGGGESVCHHPLSLPHHVVIIHCHCHIMLSSSAPLHHRPVAVFISCCYCCVTSSLPKVAEGKGVMWQWLAEVDVILWGRGQCCLAHVTAMSCCHRPPVSIIFAWPLSCVVVNTKGGRGWGGDVAVVGSGRCCCVR